MRLKLLKVVLVSICYPGECTNPYINHIFLPLGRIHVTTAYKRIPHAARNECNLSNCATAIFTPALTFAAIH
jgi:hypothetical protein